MGPLILFAILTEEIKATWYVHTPQKRILWPLYTRPCTEIKCLMNKPRNYSLLHCMGNLILYTFLMQKRKEVSASLSSTLAFFSNLSHSFSVVHFHVPQIRKASPESISPQEILLLPSPSPEPINWCIFKWPIRFWSTEDVHYSRMDHICFHFSILRRYMCLHSAEAETKIQFISSTYLKWLAQDTQSIQGHKQLEPTYVFLLL